MSTLSKITINITIEAGSAPAHEPQQPPATMADQLRCEQFYSCSSDYCAKHGCRNALPHSQQEVRS